MRHFFIFALFVIVSVYGQANQINEEEQLASVSVEYSSLGYETNTLDFGTNMGGIKTIQ